WLVVRVLCDVPPAGTRAGTMQRTVPTSRRQLHCRAPFQQTIPNHPGGLLITDQPRIDDQVIQQRIINIPPIKLPQVTPPPRSSISINFSAAFRSNMSVSWMR